jgi:hypothetical protein
VVERIDDNCNFRSHCDYEKIMKDYQSDRLSD